MITYRPMNPETDLPALAVLINLTTVVSVTPKLLEEWRLNADPGRLRQQLVAVDERDSVVGMGDCMRDPWTPPGLFWIDVAVAPEYRRQGIGTALYNASEAWAREQGAVILGADVRDDLEDSLDFATSRFFIEVQHTAEYCLNLADFDPAAFAPRIASLAAEGFDLLSFEAAGDTRDHRKAVYKLHKRVIVDDPDFTGEHLPFAEYSKRIFESSWSRADELIVALRGAAWIGYAQLADFPDSSTAMLSYAGVEKAFRGRGLATALIALALTHAKARGVISVYLGVEEIDDLVLALVARFNMAADVGSWRMLRKLNVE